VDPSCDNGKNAWLDNDPTLVSWDIVKSGIYT
jgi:hypothetical protein